MGARPRLWPFVWRALRDQGRSVALSAAALAVLLILAVRAEDPSPYVLVGLLVPGALAAIDHVARTPEDRATGFLRVMATAPLPRPAFAAIPALVLLLQVNVLGALFVLLTSGQGVPWRMETSLAAQGALGLWNVAVALPLAASAQRPAGAVAVLSAIVAGHAVSAWTVIAQFDLPPGLAGFNEALPGALVVTAAATDSLAPVALAALQGAVMLAVGFVFLGWFWFPMDGMDRRTWMTLSLMVALTAAATRAWLAWRPFP